MRIAVLLLLLVPTVAELRTWTDTTGRHTTRAELLEYHGGVAYLKSNGKVKPVPVAKLSEADRKYVQAAHPVKTLSGKVVSIADGDTFTLLDAEKQQHKIRLEGIDAPESKQAFGTQSRKALADRVFNKQVTVEWKEKDQYGRILGHVIVDDQWINKQQVADGWAWHFKRYSKSAILADAENAARKAKLGLWADKEPIPPWEFRNPPAESRPPPVAITSAIAPAAVTPREITVYVTDSGGKYHREGCRFLKKSKRAIPLSQAVGSYEPCKVCHPPTQ